MVIIVGDNRVTIESYSGSIVTLLFYYPLCFCIFLSPSLCYFSFNRIDLACKIAQSPLYKGK